MNALRAILVFCLLSINGTGASATAVRFEKIAGDLSEPWAITFLNDGAFLVTERGGRLIHFTARGRRQVVSGLPDIHVGGQGGLLDVVAARDFAITREVFFSYVSGSVSRSGTTLAVARLAPDGAALGDVRVLFTMKTPSRGGRHFGGRIAEAADGTLYLSLGDRGDRDEAQSLANHNGAIIHIRRDGSVPGHLLADRGLAEIWSFGHRNPQGLAFDGLGRLWAVEHGAQGGDEVNHVREGVNFGWPVIGYGRHYSGATIGEGTAKAGMAQPDLYWDPSIAPSGFAIYAGRMFPGWQGDFLIGSLKFDMISRVTYRAGRLVEVERITAPETGRVRDVRVAPDGSVWFLSVENRAVFRMLRAD